METQNVETWALRTLRRGVLYLLVGIIIYVIAEMYVIAEGAGYLFGVYFFDALIEPAGIMDAWIVYGLLTLVYLVISLYAIFTMIRPGMRQLSEVDNRFRICYTGATLLLVGLVMYVPGFIVLVAVFAAAGFSPEATWGTALGGLILMWWVLFIGFIIGLIGGVLTFVVGAFKLHSRYQNSLYMAAGILYVIDILLMFLGFGVIGGILTAVGDILMYIALGDTINKISTATTTPAQA
jgi:hypothetical protein